MANSHIEGRKIGSHSIVFECARLARFLEGRGAILRAIGDTIAFCPPMIISEAELNELFDRFEKALDDTEAWVDREGLRAA